MSMNATVVTPRDGFKEATRSLTSVLAPLEKRTLIWLAHRMPYWVNSDHLTGLALIRILRRGRRRRGGRGHCHLWMPPALQAVLTSSVEMLGLQSSIRPCGAVGDRWPWWNPRIGAPST